MKLISAVIRPECLNPVRERLAAAGLAGLTASTVAGVGQQAGHRESYRGQNFVVDLLPKVKIELAVHERSVERAIEAITEGARSGAMGDGKIWITSLDGVVRIRTGERGQDAL
ncbi:P-II family nitrogen regulator [Falsarthrobacter nasiphocae]|uniref:Nitrogen regulatory protein PII n=1 Tax=Falsarthrobacter nasiphocae TaxID=189863 RepID=A0AAE4C748_9MICC|nr:P-II family nitrogen regulator [Falsarthrobacter nasiphocae]MDR6892867.1 nitrogen regulatory protein PII [Falsarthrobacter nasiphocae]